MSEPPKNKTSEAQIKAVARYRSNGVRKQVDFHGDDIEILKSQTAGAESGVSDFRGM